jgi:hypothetical protein
MFQDRNSMVVLGIGRDERREASPRGERTFEGSVVEGEGM